MVRHTSETTSRTPRKGHSHGNRHLGADASPSQRIRLPAATRHRLGRSRHRVRPHRGALEICLLASALAAGPQRAGDRRGLGVGQPDLIRSSRKGPGHSDSRRRLHRRDPRRHTGEQCRCSGSAGTDDICDLAYVASLRSSRFPESGPRRTWNAGPGTGTGDLLGRELRLTRSEGAARTHRCRRITNRI